MDQIADKSVVGTDFAAEAFLARLGERGIEYVFANAGTDFAPIIEAVSRNSAGRNYPRFITVPRVQWEVGREFHRRIKNAFDAAGVLTPVKTRPVQAQPLEDRHAPATEGPSATPPETGSRS